MDLDEFKLRINSTISRADSPIDRLELVADLLGAAFGVGKDEVAIFAFDKNREMLVFIWPRSLKTVGSIPLNAHRCLVAKTAVENKGGLDNCFASTPHLHMFEHFLADKKKRVPIQKIMSVAIMSGDLLKGVVQIARKGEDRDSAGADFTSADLASLSVFAEQIAEYL